jgi:hypothetical protein
MFPQFSPIFVAMLRSPEGAVGTLDRPDGTRLRTLEAGTGTPVLLVHGGR